MQKVDKRMTRKQPLSVAEHLRNKFNHSLIVGTFPIDALTCWTCLKLFIPLPYHGRKALKNRIFADRHKKGVASKATLQRS